MKGRPIPADLLDAESSREQKSCSAQNQQPEILLFSHGNQIGKKERIDPMPIASPNPELWKSVA
jgi:hypothetical protein